MFCRESDSTMWQSQVLVSVLSGKDSDATVTVPLSVTTMEASITVTASCRDETTMWVFTHLFHLQIYVWGRSPNVSLMVSPWRLSSVPASSSSSRLSLEMSEASRVTSHQESYGREDSCRVLSLRLAIWTPSHRACSCINVCVCVLPA